MEKVIDALTKFIIENSKYSVEDYDILKYGFQVGIEILVTIIPNILIAFKLNMIIEEIILLGIFMGLRTYSGGIHFSYFLPCFILSNLVLCGILWMTKYQIFPILFIVILQIFCSLYICYFGAIENKNRKLDSIEKFFFSKKVRNRMILIDIIYIMFFLQEEYNCVAVIALALASIAFSMALEGYQHKKIWRRY